MNVDHHKRHDPINHDRIVTWWITL